MQKIKTLFSSLRKKLQSSPVVGYSLVALGIGVFGFISYLIVEANTRVAQEPPPIAKPRPAEKFYSPLNGIEVKGQTAAEKPITAVMIENSPDARPQSGLAEGEVVYEAVAEGGITRFLVLYQQKEPKLIGPVRSLRSYYVDWLAPYNPSVAHVGGSHKALQTIRNGKYRDLDQFFYPDTYWRAGDRYAPHNVYTNSKKLAALNKKKGYTKSKLEGLPRQDAPKERQASVTKINIDFSSSTYNTRYTYSKKSNNYTRAYATESHNDREKGAIKPSVVIAMKTSMHAVNEDGYRESIKTSGSGEAIIFQNGSAIKATWKKASLNAQLKFVDKDGKPVELNRGLTWIAAVPVNQSGKVSWQ